MPELGLFSSDLWLLALAVVFAFVLSGVYLTASSAAWCFFSRLIRGLLLSSIAFIVLVYIKDAPAFLAQTLEPNLNSSLHLHVC